MIASPRVQNTSLMATRTKSVVSNGMDQRTPAGKASSTRSIVARTSSEMPTTSAPGRGKTPMISAGLPRWVVKPLAPARMFHHMLDRIDAGLAHGTTEIGRASCRERVCKYVLISVVVGSLKKKHTTHNQHKRPR